MSGEISFAEKYGKKDANNPFGANSKDQKKALQSDVEAAENVAHIVSDANSSQKNAESAKTVENVLDGIDFGEDPDLIEVEALLSQANSLEDIDALIDSLAGELSSMDPEILQLKSEKEKEKIMKLIIALKALQAQLNVMKQNGIKFDKAALLNAMRAQVAQEFSALKAQGGLSADKFLSAIESALKGLDTAMKMAGKDGINTNLAINAGNGKDIMSVVNNMLKQMGIDPQMLNAAREQMAQQQLPLQQQMNQNAQQNQVNLAAQQSNVINLAERLAAMQQVSQQQPAIAAMQQSATISMLAPANNNIEQTVAATVAAQQQTVQSSSLAAMTQASVASTVNPNAAYNALTTSKGDSPTDGMSKCGNCSGNCAECGSGAKAIEKWNSMPIAQSSYSESTVAQATQSAEVAYSAILGKAEQAAQASNALNNFAMANSAPTGNASISSFQQIQQSQISIIR